MQREEGGDEDARKLAGRRVVDAAADGAMGRWSERGQRSMGCLTRRTGSKTRPLLCRSPIPHQPCPGLGPLILHPASRANLHRGRRSSLLAPNTSLSLVPHSRAFSAQPLPPCAASISVHKVARQTATLDSLESDSRLGAHIFFPLCDALLYLPHYR